MTPAEIVEVIMTQHWDMKACECWVCEAGRAAGCRPRDVYLPHHGAPKLARVTVPWRAG